MEIFETEFKEKIVEILLKEKIIKKYKIKQDFGITEDNKPLNNLFEKQFKELKKDEVIKKVSKSTYTLNLSDDCCIGKIYFNLQGNGFLLDEKTNTKYFIYSENSLNALHGDLVIVKPTREATQTKKPEAKVLSVLRRDIKKIIGTYIEYDNGARFVIPDNAKINRDIYIPQGKTLNANPYDKVVVNIIKYPSYKKDSSAFTIFNPEGEIIEIIGMTGEKGVDSLSIIKANNIREDFPGNVLADASEIPLEIPNEEIEKRLDLRDKVIYTIDGEDSKDLDDAISVEKTDFGYELGVHIADVSHYVREDSSIDKEALLRGTSVYLVDRVIPMLPKVLSNGVCSLNQDEDKLTLSCIISLDNNGCVIKSKVVESVINSNARLTYHDVTDYLENGTKIFEEKFSIEVANSLKIAKDLAILLKKQRDIRGSIEFDTLETKFVLDDDGKVVEVKPYERGVSNDIIEEFMLLANETIAKKFYDLKLPFVYRIHDYPKIERLELFDKIAKNYGFDISLAGEKHIEPKTIQQFLEDNKDKEEIIPLKEILLHSMQQARYSNVCSMHFGLASKYYCHFTSPIRRYPDLQIHRIIKKSLYGEMNNVNKLKYEKITEEVAEHCSKTERIADEAERDLDRQKMYEFMLNNVNCEYEGYIRNFNKKGIFVTLDNSGEGFVKPIDYEFDENLYQASFGGKTYKLGDRVKVKIKNNNVTTKEIIFEIL